MKTKMQATSLEAYYGIREKLGAKEHEVLEVIHEFQPISDRQLANKLGWEIGSVNGRRNHLVERGVVEEAYRAGSTATGRRVIYWRIRMTAEEEELVSNILLVEGEL